MSRAQSFVVAAFVSVFAAACGVVEQPKTTPFYAETAPPPAAEFRWSNGKAPKSLDPALAAAAPETDIVRAIFEGLTEIDPKTLEARPAAAEKWESIDNYTTWKFHLRENAKWSNGKSVTAGDFERSWRRLFSLGERAAHAELLANFRRTKTLAPVRNAGEPGETGNTSRLDETPADQSPPTDQPQNDNAQAGEPSPRTTREQKKVVDEEFGVKAEDERTLTVSLVRPDPDLPKLIAHPIFRPIFGTTSPDAAAPPESIVTNGAFRVASRGADGLIVIRSETYWNTSKVGLDRVRFVPSETAEAALGAYRHGELDAVTNIEFSPLVLKLLEPYTDFRRNTHGALNFYEVNYHKYPFDDRRVREALTTAIERERLTESELAGTTQPALQYLPFGARSVESIMQDARHAAELLADAGFPDGANFPPVRLVVNRNDVQIRIARSVARMWKQNLNIEAEVIVKESGEMEEVRLMGDFDVIRRGVVLPTADEIASLSAIIGNDVVTAEARPKDAASPELIQKPRREMETNISGEPTTVLSQDEELFRLYAIPLYFPTSYALVKPYVAGFEMGGIDAPVLGDVRIDTSWQPKKAAAESN